MLLADGTVKELGASGKHDRTGIGDRKFCRWGEWDWGSRCHWVDEAGWTGLA